MRPRKSVASAINETFDVFLPPLFPEQTTAATMWWMVLREKFKEESPTAVLKRLRALMEGKTAAKDVKAWIAEAEPLIARSANTVARLAAQRQALAETAVKAGFDDLAVALLIKADSREALLRLGDLLAAKKQWAKAAERYRQAWHKELEKMSPGNQPRFRRTIVVEIALDPLPLYLAGDALIHAGQEKDGKKLIEQAHWIPLSNAATRYSFFLALMKRGHIKAAEREADMLLRVSEPNSFYSGEALRRVAIAALKCKEYLKAAKGFEQSMLRCLHPTVNFLSVSSYANVPAQIHQLCARSLLAAGKLDEALRQVDLALAASPGYVNLPIALVPELERRGHKKEAATLFAHCQGVYEKVCQAYPRCAWAHNLAAWMSACCRRNLDKALQHAEKAVELSPSTAGYLDTLAEVHFQRGHKDKAIAMQKRAIKLNPKKSYYRKQLKRLEAGDPSAERPSENDEE